MPSEASPGFLISPVPAVWRKKPFLPPSSYTAVTTPSVVTVWPSSGEVSPVPWISAIGVISPGAMGCSTGSFGSGSVGAGSTGAWPEPLGVGVATVKSAALLSVSMPRVMRWIEVALVVPSAEVPSAREAPPQPTRSTSLLFASSKTAIAPLPLKLNVALSSSAPVIASPLEPGVLVIKNVLFAGTTPESVCVFPVLSPVERCSIVQPVMSMGWSVGL